MESLTNMRHVHAAYIVQPPTWEGKKLEASESAWLLEVFLRLDESMHGFPAS